jgi:hypothetical protein
MELKLNTTERDLLEGLLSASLGNLREEVYHAEEPHYKDELKAEEEELRALLAKVKALARAA